MGTIMRSYSTVESKQMSNIRMTTKCRTNISVVYFLIFYFQIQNHSLNISKWFCLHKHRQNFKLYKKFILDKKYKIHT